MLNKVQRATKILIQIAKDGETITYEDIAFQLRIATSGNALGKQTSDILVKVHDWCVDNDIPPLTSLVVRKSGSDKGIPGRGFWQLYELDNACYDTKHSVMQIMHLAVRTYFKNKEILFTTGEHDRVVRTVEGRVPRVRNA